MNKFKSNFTLITSLVPTILAKKHYLNNEGEYCCETSAHMSQGTAETIAISSLQEFVNILQNAKTNNAICAGITKFSSCEIVSKSTFRYEQNTITRTKEYFHFNKNISGILILDYDPPKNSIPLSQEQFINAIATIIPDFTKYAYVWTTSSSSQIYNGNSEVRGILGQRLYLFIKDSSDIPRAGRNLHQRLFINGYGYFSVSRSGKKLERSIIDTSVWQPNHLDFIGGAHCIDPIYQKIRDIKFNEGDLLDTHEILKELSESEENQFQVQLEQKKKSVKREAESHKIIYQNDMTLKILKNSNPDSKEFTDQETSDALQIVKAACSYQTLSGDFMITLEDGSTVTINEILKYPEKYHGKQTLDPLEPEYHNNKIVGKLYLNSNSKNLFSFAHGGCNYRLRPSIHKIRFYTGQIKKLTDETLEYLRSIKVFFDYYDDQLVFLEGNHLITMNKDNLAYYLSSYISYYQVDDNKIKYIEPNAILIKNLLSIKRYLPPISTVTDLPIILENGSVIVEPGYSEKHKIFLTNYDEQFEKIENISIEQLNQAIKYLLFPFDHFPFKTPLDFSVALSAILTAIVRPILPTSPAFAFDAPTQGSGKSYLAQCILTLYTGKPPTTFPPVENKYNDDEIRKRLTGNLLSHDWTLMLDNIVDIFDSPVIATLLTNPQFSDRLLHQNKNVTFDNKILFALTGNNIEFTGDMVRRVLKCRLDAEIQDPNTRFFVNNPLEYIKNNRHNLAIAGLTIIKAYFESDAFKSGEYSMKGKLASFETWDKLVRCPILWLSDIFNDAKYVDPIQSIQQSLKTDPDTQLWGRFLEEIEPISTIKNKWLEAREIYALILQNEKSINILDNLQDLLNTEKITNHMFGKALAYRKDKIVNNLRIIQKQSTSRNTYKLERIC